MAKQRKTPRKKRWVRLILLAGAGLSIIAGSGWTYWELSAPRPDETISVSMPGQSSRRITVDVFLPEASHGGGPSPAVVHLHGVEGADRYAWLHYYAARSLADEGYTVFFVHYFDSVAYDDLWLVDEGELEVDKVDAFAQRDRRLWTTAVAEAVATIARRPDVDAGRIALLGFSLGSFVAYDVAAESIVDDSIPPIAAVVGNWGSSFERRPPPPGFPPTYHIHGEHDEIVPLEWARETCRAIESSGADVQLDVVPQAGHVATSDETWRRMVAFFKTRLANN